MADLAVVQAIPQPGARLRRYTAAVGVTAGDVLRRDPTSSYAGGVRQADANAADPAIARVVGIAANTALAGAPVTAVVEGDVDLGVAVTRAVWYGLSVNAGKIAPVADMVSGNYASLIGYGKGGNILHITRVNSEQLM